MKIKLTSSKTWIVTKFEAEHPTHLLSSPDKVFNHYSHRQSHRSKTCKRIIENLSEEGMAPSTIARVYNVVSKSIDEEYITAQQCIDHIRTRRKNNIDNECISIIKNFQDRKEIDPEFYFSIELDQTGTLRSVFWADGRSISSYLSFGDVVVFDVTYKTNHLSLPFAPFTGVNHHRQSILFGCALLADEQEDTFIWLFTQWLKCMHGVAPNAIITDQDAQIGGAIRQQLPMKAQYGDEISTYFDKWYRASTIHKCEERWKILKENFNIDESVDSWLTRMYRLRAHWVDAYLKDIFWAGMTTSQRSESINAFFDGYVNTKTRLVDFLTAVPDNYILQRWKIDARHKNIRFFNDMDVRSNEGSMEQCDIIRLWAIRARFNATLEMASCSANAISMVERMLQDITISVEKEVKLNEIHIANSQIGSQISSNANVVLRDGEEILIRDPSGPVKTKGRPRGASRYKSGIEESQSKKDIKHRKCGNCQQLGHYKTGCPLLLNENWSGFLSTTCMDLWKMKFSLLREISVQKWEATWKCRLEMVLSLFCNGSYLEM
ncbi:protein FAR1-RELATED SEQUENCE 5-like [Asparagus officinalis]|uniref:protein FAR1-RELATED SEQUENCE 5-like n=1 Tax=Asparagus officinalis TaxID=4686 RepID=UPI00098DF75C|nr:protein FAR1-RELATED SEQUENCE 5-like [Asparagus officinalis]